MKKQYILFGVILAIPIFLSIYFLANYMYELGKESKEKEMFNDGAVRIIQLDGANSITLQGGDLSQPHKDSIVIYSIPININITK